MFIATGRVSTFYYEKVDDHKTRTGGLKKGKVLLALWGQGPGFRQKKYAKCVNLEESLH